MSRFAPMGTRRLACGAIAAVLLAATACSGTVEASYRPPPPAPPTPAPTTVAPTPSAAAPTTQVAPVAACGPDQVAVQVGEVQADASSRAVPLLIRAKGVTACGVANPVGIELLDTAGAPLTTRVQVADLPAGRTAVAVIPAVTGDAPSAAAPSGPPPTGAPTSAPAESPSTGNGTGNGVMVWLQWRAEPSVRTADPATDCADATGLLLTLADAAPPISVTAKLKACDGGTVYVSPAEANIG
jgi:hypothetical protein